MLIRYWVLRPWDLHRCRNRRWLSQRWCAAWTWLKLGSLSQQSRICRPSICSLVFREACQRRRLRLRWLLLPEHMTKLPLGYRKLLSVSGPGQLTSSFWQFSRKTYSDCIKKRPGVLNAPKNSGIVPVQSKSLVLGVKLGSSHVNLNRSLTSAQLIDIIR